MASPLSSLPRTASPRDIAEALSPGDSSPLALLIGDLDSRPTRVFPFPGFSGPEAPTVALWALTDEESRKAQLDAHHYCTVTRKLPREVAERLGMIDAESRVRLLLAAMRRPEQPEFPFASPGELGANEVRRLSVDVQDALMVEYVHHLDARSPLRRLEADGLNAHIEELVIELGKGVPATALISSYDTGTLRLLVTELLERAAGIKDNSSGSSALSDGPTSSSAPPVDGELGPEDEAAVAGDGEIVDMRGGDAPGV